MKHAFLATLKLLLAFFGERVRQFVKNRLRSLTSDGDQRSTLSFQEVDMVSIIEVRPQSGEDQLSAVARTIDQALSGWSNSARIQPCKMLSGVESCFRLHASFMIRDSSAHTSKYTILLIVSRKIEQEIENDKITT